jgi:predicted amidohydrolase YtcJ
MARLMITMPVFLLSLLFAAPQAVGQQSPPDLILYNGKVFTSAAAHPYAQALAIRGERIVAVGDDGDVRKLSGSQTRQIDLAGHTVIPGINDAHNHLGIASETVEFKSFNPTLAEVGDTIVAAARRTPAPTIIFGWIAQSAYFDTALNRDSLDKLVPDHPVVLFTVSGHAGILNSAALAKFGIHDGDRDPIGGRYERNPDSRLTGVLREYAALDVERKVTDLASDAGLAKGLSESLADAAKAGVTSVQDMSGAISPDRCLALLEQIPSPIRVRVVRMAGSAPNGRDTGEGLSILHHHSGLVAVSGTKWMLDGTPLEGTFATRQAQAELFSEIDRQIASDTAMSPLEHFLETLGPTFPREQMAAMLGESLRAHDQLMVHVVGYPATLAMLDAMQSSGGTGAWAARRVRFEHGTGLFPDLIPRAKELGVIVVANPTQLAWTRHFAHGVRLSQAQPLKSLIAAGVPVAFGSDNAGDFNPFLDIMLASTDPDRPSEAITREQAVIAYTLTAAYAEFAEKEKGSLEPGKLADLAVLSQDIFAVPSPELPKTRSVFTVVGGKIIYDANLLNTR